MSESLIANREQAALWNETAGRAWVEMQRVLDEMMAPFIPLLIEHSLNNETCRVLDIGCGAGSTTLSAASRLSPGGLCVGVDISAALLEVARQRAMKEAPSKAAFVQADAQTHAFEPHVFDAVISRFGVMFFDDPQAAFVNIRGAARSDAPLTFVAWRGPAENPFMTRGGTRGGTVPDLFAGAGAERAGQFGFADPGWVRHVLESSGWKDIDIRPIDVPASVAEQDLLPYVTRLGPVGVALKEVDEQTRTRTIAAVRAAFDPFVQDGSARFNAACWLVRARA